MNIIYDQIYGLVLLAHLARCYYIIEIKKKRKNFDCVYIKYMCNTVCGERLKSLSLFNIILTVLDLASEGGIVLKRDPRLMRCYIFGPQIRVVGELIHHMRDACQKSKANENGYSYQCHKKEFSLFICYSRRSCVRWCIIHIYSGNRFVL
jgi:hypothetical protein